MKYISNRRAKIQVFAEGILRASKKSIEEEMHGVKLALIVFDEEDKNCKIRLLTEISDANLLRFIQNYHAVYGMKIQKHC